MSAPRRKPATSDQMRVVGYVRVSTEEQGRHGVSLAAQKERIEHYCGMRGEKQPWTLLRVYQDVASGKDTERPGLNRLLTDAKTGAFDVVVFTKLDRFSRRVSDWVRLQEELRKREVALVSISEGFDDTTPIGRAMSNMIAVFAQLERETTVERIKVALSHKKEHRQVYSRFVPYGFKGAGKGSTFLPQAREMKVVDEIFERRKGLPGERGESLRAIASALTKRGIPTPQGGSQWSAETVRLILRNAPLYGRIVNDISLGEK